MIFLTSEGTKITNIAFTIAWMTRLDKAQISIKVKPISLRFLANSLSKNINGYSPYVNIKAVYRNSIRRRYERKKYQDMFENMPVAFLGFRITFTQ